MILHDIVVVRLYKVKHVQICMCSFVLMILVMEEDRSKLKKLVDTFKYSMLWLSDI